VLPKCKTSSFFKSINPTESYQPVPYQLLSTQSEKYQKRYNAISLINFNQHEKTSKCSDLLGTLFNSRYHGPECELSCSQKSATESSPQQIKTQIMKYITVIIKSKSKAIPVTGHGGP
jgi:hypothetical protein